METLTVAQHQIQMLGQAQRQRCAPTVLAAELLVVVVAQAQFGGEAVATIAVLDESSPVPAFAAAEVAVAAKAVFVPIEAEQQLVSVAESQGVDPAGAVAVRVVDIVVVGIQRVAVLALILAMAEFQTAAPAVGELCFEMAGDAGDAEAFAGVARIETEQVVVLALATLLEQAQAALEAVVEAMLQAQVEGLAAQAVVIVVVTAAVLGTVEAGAFDQAGAEVEAGALVAAGQTQAALEGLLTASGQAQARLGHPRRAE